MHLDEISLCAADLPPLEHFYQQTLGLLVSTLSGAALRIQAGSSRRTG
jgi:catechol-2,3-dioxygenase